MLHERTRSGGEREDDSGALLCHTVHQTSDSRGRMTGEDPTSARALVESKKVLVAHELPQRLQPLSHRLHRSYKTLICLEARNYSHKYLIYVHDVTLNA